MSESKTVSLSGVSETLLITLYLWAMESQRPDALIKDEKAVALRRPLILGDLARLGDRKMGQWHPSAQRVGILRPA